MTQSIEEKARKLANQEYCRLSALQSTITSWIDTSTALAKRALLAEQESDQLRAEVERLYGIMKEYRQDHFENADCNFGKWDEEAKELLERTQEKS